VSDLGKAIQLLMDQNIKFKSPGWMFAPRTWKALYTKLDSNNNYIFRPEVEQGKLLGIPYEVTTNIPINLTAPSGSGGGSDGSEVILADFFHVLIGETMGLRISTSTEASYTSGGSQRSSFEYGETLTLVEMEHDLMCRQAGKEVVVIETTWGTV
jgi:HK97 family phage major capsid protein